MAKNCERYRDRRSSLCNIPKMAANWGDIGRTVPIDVLTDDVLLHIFDFCFPDKPGSFIPDKTEVWQELVHVCRRWRELVFRSSRRLDLQLLCTTRTPAEEMLNIWPALPLVIRVDYRPGMKNISAALKHRDRISGISISHPSSSLLSPSRSLLPPEIQKPFPTLKSLDIKSPQDLREGMDDIPYLFSGGLVPHLQHLQLETPSFPTLLPMLLCSTTNLLTITLRLWETPRFGCILPEAIVTVLAALTSLESFYLTIKSRAQSDQSPGQESRPPPPRTRFSLPTLTYFMFKGESEYLEDLVAGIDASPLLDRLEVYLFYQPKFYMPHLSQFISRVPRYQALDDASMVISGGVVSVKAPSNGQGMLTMGIISHNGSGWRPSFLAQLCASSLPLSFLVLKDLYMRFPLLYWQSSDNEHAQWLELLSPFTAVENLYLSRRFVPCIAHALQEVDGERVTEVLPALRNLYLAELQPLGPAQQAIEQFVCARRLSTHPIAVSQWDVGETMGGSW